MGPPPPLPPSSIQPCFDCFPLDACFFKAKAASYHCVRALCPFFLLPFFTPPSFHRSSGCFLDMFLFSQWITLLSFSRECFLFLSFCICLLLLTPEMYGFHHPFGPRSLSPPHADPLFLAIAPLSAQFAFFVEDAQTILILQTDV